MFFKVQAEFDKILKAQGTQVFQTLLTNKLSHTLFYGRHILVIMETKFVGDKCIELKAAKYEV